MFRRATTQTTCAWNVLNLMCCVSKQHAWHIRPLLKSLRYFQPNTFRLGKISLNSKNFRVGQSPSMSCQLSYRPWGITTFISVPRTPKHCLPWPFFWVLPTAQKIQLTRFRRTCLEMDLKESEGKKTTTTTTTTNWMVGFFMCNSITIHHLTNVLFREDSET